MATLKEGFPNWNKMPESEVLQKHRESMHRQLKEESTSDSWFIACRGLNSPFKNMNETLSSSKPVEDQEVLAAEMDTSIHDFLERSRAKDSKTKKVFDLLPGGDVDHWSYNDLRLDSPR